MRDFEILDINDLSEHTGKLYGPVTFADDFQFFESNGMIRIMPITDNKSRKHVWLSFNDFDFFQEIINYGEKLYSILKNELLEISITTAPPQIYKDSYFRIVSEESICNHFKDLEPICWNFLHLLGVVPIHTSDYYDYYYNERLGFPLSLIINHILLIYVIHTAYCDMGKNYNSLKQLYLCLGITSEMDNQNIYSSIIKCLNRYSKPDYHISYFSMEIVNTSSKTFVPITVTPNIFAFAFITLQNNIATQSFVMKENSEGITQYVCFRKCANCLSTFNEVRGIENPNKLPVIKTKYCDDCKKKFKKSASSKYEHSIRKMYNELKDHIDECPADIAMQIKNLHPKDEVTKKELETLYKAYKNISNM